MPAFIFCCMRPTMNWLVSKYRAAHWLMQLASLELSDDPGFLMHISKHWSLRRLMACLRIAFFATTAGKNNHRNTQQQRKGEKKEYTMSNFWWTRKKKLYIYNVPVAPAGWSFEAVLVMIRTTCLGGEERWRIVQKTTYFFSEPRNQTHLHKVCLDLRSRLSASPFWPNKNFV